MGAWNRLTNRINRRAGGAWFVATIALFTGLLALAAPNPDHLPSLWVAHSRDTVKLDAATGQPLLALADGGKVRTLLVDPLRNRLWSYRNHRLHAYGFDGTPELTIQLPEEARHRRDRDDEQDEDRERDRDDDRDDDEEKDDRGTLALQPADGTLWLAVDDRLHRFDAEGTLLGTLETRRRIRGIVADPENGWLWVAEDRRLTAYDGNGEQRALIELSRRDKIRALTWSPSHRQLWVVLQRNIRRIDQSGTTLFEHRVRNAGHPVADGAGGLWFVSNKEVRHIDAAGLETLRLSPFDRRDRVIALTSDLADGGVWAAAKRSLRKIAVDGELGETITAAEGRRSPHILALAAYSDILPPTLEITAPEEGALLNDNRPLIELDAADGGIGVDRDTLTLHIDDAPLTVSCEGEEPLLNCLPSEALPEGDTRLTASVEDYAGNRSETVERRLTIDTVPPVITVETPTDGLITNQPRQTLGGTLSETATLTLNGEPLAIDADHGFNATLVLNEGSNPISLEATDLAGNHAERALLIHLDTQPPSSPQADAVTFVSGDGGLFTLSASAGSVEPSATVIVANGDTVVTTQADGEGAFELEIDAESGDTLSLTVTDAAGNVSAALEIPLGPPLPPDPATVAPPLEGADFASGIGFLFQGARPIQTGVVPDTIEARRAAVVRGRVLRNDGSPLSGVTITIKDHPELGRTVSRADGWFDLAVNGGGVLTLDYRRDGFLPVQRQLDTPWQDYALAPDIIMLPLDPAATVVDLAGATEIQVARGSVVSDADGERQATLLIPPGTQATLTLPDGSQQSLETLTVRATEYTVGEGGPDAMPGPLPPTSGYTYAVELSADEAVALNAERIDFDRPLPYYVDNFLGFPVGGPVPAGWYDYRRAAWIPSDNGRIIEVVAVNEGVADVDIDGDGLADDETQLAELGIDTDERARLAELYVPGKSLWRIPLTHFTPWDLNWPFKLADDAIDPGDDPDLDPKTPEGPRPDDKDTNACDGCIINAQAQTLGEEVPLAGSAFSLHYRSDRTPGYLASRTLEIPLTGSALPPSVDGVELTIEFAGRKITERFPPEPNLHYTFQWDGLDTYGREVPGAIEVKVTIGYGYLVYYATPRVTSSGSFGMPGSTIVGNSYRAAGVWYWARSSWHRKLGGFDARRPGLGGWTLNHHHSYDPLTGILSRGNGVRREVDSQGTIIDTLARGRKSLRDEGALSKISADTLYGIATDEEGNYYLGSFGYSIIYKVKPDDTFEWIAGAGRSWWGSYDDDVPARDAGFHHITDLEVGADGALYVADSRNRQIRRLGEDGLIDIFAGGGSQNGEFPQDGDPARGASLSYITAVASDPSGNVYFVDSGWQRVALVTPEGTIRRIAGNGTHGDAGDGGPALDASFNFSYDNTGLAVDASGNVYVSDSGNNRVRVIRPDGTIDTFAGNGEPGYNGDGGPAREANLYAPGNIAVDRNGGLWIADTYNAVVRYVAPNGIITTIAGTGHFGYTGDGGSARRAQIGQRVGLGLLPSGEIILADYNNSRIRKLSSAKPQRNLNGPTAVVSEDGSEQYLFDATGRHQATIDTLSGATLYTFGYDGEKQLTEITDVDGNRTIIERNAAGNPVAIVTPDGQRTTLQVSAEGYLVAVTDPIGGAHTFGYDAGGLLSSFSTPRHNVSRYRYNADGKLLEDEDPAGGGWQLSREETADGYVSQMISGEGRVHRFAVEALADGGRVQTNTDPSGFETLREFAADDTERTLTPDGTLERVVRAPDPRFGMASPLESERTVTLPSGLVHTTRHTREAELTLVGDPLSLTTLSDTWQVNGRRFESVYDAANRTLEETSAGGSVTTTELDVKGRVIVERSAGLAPVHYGYDTRGRLTSAVEESDTERREYHLAYDDDGWLAAVTDPLGRETRYTYDPAGRVIGQAFPDGRSVAYGYDAAGNLTTLSTPNGDLHHFAYTPRDLESAYTPPELAPEADPATHYHYNLDKAATEVIRPDGRRLTLDYDGGGRLTTVTQHEEVGPTGATAYDYEPVAGRLASITAPDGNVLFYTYDGPLPLSERWQGEVNGATSRLFDENFWIVERSVNGADPVAFQYDHDGLLTLAGDLALTRDPESGLTTTTVQGAVATQRGYNAFGELASERVEVDGAALIETSYSRDLLGRITEKSETLEGVTTTERYRYDAAGRLVEVDRDGVVTSYDYDANGNRLARDGPDGLESGEYDAQDRLVAYNGDTYTYTINGELRTVGSPSGEQTTYDYDLHGNLLAVELPGGSRIDYLVDGRNRRIGKKIDGVLIQGLLYKDQLNPIAELDGEGNVVARFVYGDKDNVPAYMVKGGVTYRILSDHLGSPRLVVDTESGAVAQRMAYDAFGRVVEDTHPGFQPFGFAGGLWDRDSGLVRFGARDYDPGTGRWTSKDPIRFDGGDSNLFGYSFHDPINVIDPYGYEGKSCGNPGFPEYDGPPDLPLEEVCIECWIVPGLKAAKWAKAGKELKIGKDARIAPFGNRKGDNLINKVPHYHRRGAKAPNGETRPGQGIGRHRPWESSTHDKSWRDRF